MVTHSLLLLLHGTGVLLCIWGGLTRLDYYVLVLKKNISKLPRIREDGREDVNTIFIRCWRTLSFGIIVPFEAAKNHYKSSTAPLAAGLVAGVLSLVSSLGHGEPVADTHEYLSFSSHLWIGFCNIRSEFVMFVLI